MFIKSTIVWILWMICAMCLLPYLFLVKQQGYHDVYHIYLSPGVSCDRDQCTWDSKLLPEQAQDHEEERKSNFQLCFTGFTSQLYQIQKRTSVVFTSCGCWTQDTVNVVWNCWCKTVIFTLLLSGLGTGTDRLTHGSLMGGFVSVISKGTCRVSSMLHH